MILALCALIPVIGSIVTAFSVFKSDRSRNIFVESVIALTSVCVFIALALDGEATSELFRLNDRFVCAFRTDNLSRLFIALSALLWPFASLYSFDYMKHESRIGHFYTFYTMAYAFTILLAASANLFTLYIFYECLTIVTLPLVEHEQNKEAYRAGRAYLQFLIGGAALGFAAMVITAYLSESTLFAKGGSIIADANITVVRIAYVLMFFGFGAKAAIFPLCRWLPKAGVAPTPVTALLHAVAVVNAGVYSVARGCYYVFDGSVISGSWAQYVTILAAAFTVAYGASRALGETHFKRRLAWSTVSNLSYMLSALALLTPDGMTAGLTHMVFHGLMKIVLFFAAGSVLVCAGRTDIRQTRGLAKRMPVTFFCFTFAGAALTGVPPLIGFTSKYLIITAALESAGVCGIIASCALIVSAIFTAVYIFSVAIPAYFAPESCDNSGAHKAGLCMRISMLAVCGIIAIASIFGNSIVEMIGSI